MGKHEHAYAAMVRAWVDEHYSEAAGLLATREGYSYYTDPNNMQATRQKLGGTSQEVAVSLGLTFVEEPGSNQRRAHCPSTTEGRGTDRGEVNTGGGAAPPA